MIRLSPLAFISSIFFRSFGPHMGLSLVNAPLVIPPTCSARLLTISLSDCLMPPPGLRAVGRLAPLGNRRLAPYRRLTLATTVRMVSRVHNHAADCRPDALPPRLRPALPTEMFSCSTLPTWPIVALHADQNVAHLAGRQPQLSILAFFGHKLRVPLPALRTICPPLPSFSSTL